MIVDVSVSFSSHNRTDRLQWPSIFLFGG